MDDVELMSQKVGLKNEQDKEREVSYSPVEA
jgi:hypothetical protein